ncbi:MAG: hypothetical protein JWN62_1329 [Acidimicrobiales bacterium]|nr:hypothetical protein [Acidimicrobiales bacterium]
MPDQPTLRTRTVTFISAFAVLALALLSPLDAASERALSWHMVQHLLLISVVAPLLALGRPWLLITEVFPRLAVAPLRRPGDNTAAAIGAGLSLAVLFAWHVPALYDLALRREPVHAAEHLTLLGSSMLLWAALLDARRLGTGVLWLYAITLPMTAFGLAMTIARTPWYAPYVSGSRASAVRDQQMAGVVMWAFGGLAAVVSAVAIFAVWLTRAGSFVPEELAS